MSNTQTNSGGVGILGLLFVLFVGLKLTAIINWSWWWVTAPLWGPLAAVVTIFVVGLIGAGILAGLKEASARRHVAHLSVVK